MSDDDALRRIQLKTEFRARTGCWRWIGSVDKRGRFRLELDGFEMLAHRAAWIAANGPIPYNKRPILTCKDARCICPAHMRLVDRNVRTRRKDAAPRPRLRKLRPEHVREIRASEDSVSALAEKFKVSAAHISNIKHNRRKSAVV